MEIELHNYKTYFHCVTYLGFGTPELFKKFITAETDPSSASFAFFHSYSFALLLSSLSCPLEGKGELDREWLFDERTLR